MTKDAKQAAKLEKKLKILLGGYQVGEADILELLRYDIANELRFANISFTTGTCKIF